MESNANSIVLKSVIMILAITSYGNKEGCPPMVYNDFKLPIKSTLSMIYTIIEIDLKYNARKLTVDINLIIFLPYNKLRKSQWQLSFILTRCACTLS